MARTALAQRLSGLMHLPPDQLIFGVAPALLIDCAAQIHDRDCQYPRFSLSPDDFAKALGAPLVESMPVLLAMLAEGFFEPLEGQAGRYLATPKLAQLALAKISHGVSRDEANALLVRIVEKAASVNARQDEYEHRIICVVVFGSYLTDKALLGDLDIGVALEELPGPSGRRDGEDFHAWQHRGLAARNRTTRALRLRQPKKISVHALDEVRRLNTPFNVVFGALPE